MTVKELREALASLPDDYEIVTEGCDCYGDVGSISTEDIDKYILLERS